MKPDNFSDRIRQKLESVEPEFREKDWTRMQQALGHSTPVFAIGTRAGLMAAASVAAVMAFGGVAYQQYQHNQELREQVQTLNKTVVTLRKTTAKPAQLTPLPPDTVYLTREVVRYVPVPVGQNPASTAGQTTDSAPDERLTNNRSPAGTPATDLSGDPAANPADPEGGLPSAPRAGVSTSRKESRIARNSDLKPYATETPATNHDRSMAGATPAENRQTGVVPEGSSIAARPGVRRSQPADRAPAGTYSSDNPAGGSVQDVSRVENRRGVSIPELLTLSSRPFMRDTAYYREGMARTNRRIRRLFGTATPTPTAVANVIVNRSEPAWQARVGAGGQVGWRQRGAGIWSELRLNSHWRVGLGITAVNLQGGSFLTEMDYGKRTKQDFRNNFAPQIDPRHDIINITPAGTSWRIPVTLSYRIGLGQGWSLVPTAGLNFSISNREEIGFAYLRGPGKIEPVTIVRKLPQEMLNTTYGALFLEKNWGNWSVQFGPYGTTPLSSTPSRLNIKTGGATARLFYTIDWNQKR